VGLPALRRTGSAQRIPGLHDLRALQARLPEEPTTKEATQAMSLRDRIYGKRKRKGVQVVAQVGDAVKFYYDDGTESDWVPAPGSAYPGGAFHPPDN